MIDDKTAAAELVTRAVAEAINAQEPAVRERMMAAWLAGRRAFRKVGPHRFVVLIDGGGADRDRDADRLHPLARRPPRRSHQLRCILSITEVYTLDRGSRAWTECQPPRRQPLAGVPSAANRPACSPTARRSTPT